MNTEFKIGDIVFFDDVFIDKVNHGKIIKICKNKDIVVYIDKECTVKGNPTKFFLCEHCAELTFKIRQMKKQLKNIMEKF